MADLNSVTAALATLTAAGWEINRPTRYIGGVGAVTDVSGASPSNGATANTAAINTALAAAGLVLPLQADGRLGRSDGCKER